MNVKNDYVILDLNEHASVKCPEALNHYYVYQINHVMSLMNFPFVFMSCI